MIYKFNNLELNSTNFSLSQGGQRGQGTQDWQDIAVEPRVYDLILFLIENKHKVVTRQQILEKIWKDRVVSDAAISNHIKSARKILGDDGQKQSVIKTIHGRGYQFIAKIDTLDEKKDNTESKGNKYKFILLVLAIAFGLSWYLMQNNKSIDSTSESTLIESIDKSIAVLAFKDLSPKSDQAYFSEGISEELLNLFTKIPDLRVASRTSSFSFKDKQVKLEDIGKELNVSYVMEGSVRKSKDKIRITVQLIRVKDGSHIWSETYDHELEDVFKIQDKIAKQVTQQLRIKLSKENLIKSTAVDTQAYALYLQSIYLIRQNSEASIRKSAQLIGQSISIDPNYAPSWTLMSRIMFTAVIYSYDKFNKTAYEMSKAAIAKALEIDENYAHAYAQQSLINNLQWDFKASSENVEKAMKLNPTSPTIISAAATNRQIVGRIDESVELLLKAIKLRKLVNHYYLSLGTVYLLQNELDKAYDAIREYDYFFPEAVAQHAIMSFILFHQGKFEQALTEANKEVHEYWQLSALIVANYGVGNFAESDSLLIKYQKKYAKNVPAFFASLHAYRGDTDKAFEWLNIAYEKKDPSLIITISFLPMRKLWGDPRWAELIEKLNLPQGHWLLKSE